jgi:hypothetical protein
MTTMCMQDLSEPIELATHPLKVISDALADYCDFKHLSPQQADIVIHAGKAAYCGKGTASPIEHGKRCADNIAEKMCAIRTRLGTRPDDAA